MMGRKQKILVQKTLRTTRIYSRRIVRWWIRNDRKYRVKWRAANGFLAVLLLLSVALPVLQNTLTNRRYRLSQDSLNLVGKNNQALANKLKFNTQTQAYEFNKDAIKEYNPVDALQEQVGGADDKTKPLYALDVATDPKKGVTYHDVNSQLSFKLIPQFSSLPGRTEQGRIVYPLDNGPQAVYTLKNNGLKEDIVVSNNKHDTLRFAYTLELPKSLEARQLPDGSGAIGIYAADQTLFTNMSYGSDKDRDLVEKARENAVKNNLVFGIPAPVITAKNGNTGSASARFELRGNQLTVVAESLTDIKGSYSIDPSVTVTSTSDFQDKGNNEGNISFSTSGQIGRSGITGGLVNNVSSDTTCATTTAWCSIQTGASGYNGSNGARQNATLAYNGFLYSIGGNYSNNSTSINTVSYASLNSGTGALGSWTVGSTLVGGVAKSNFGSVVYNGYIYVIGGQLQGGTGTTDIQYALICTGNNSGVGGCSSTAGSVGTWTAVSGSNFGTVSSISQRAVFGAVAYNGFIYVMGGAGNSNNFTNDVLYAPLQANGSIGAWSSTTALLFAGSSVATVYNGKIYVGLNCDKGNSASGGAGCTATTNLLIGTIDSTGAISGWSTGPAFTQLGSTGSSGIVAYNGYVYVAAGGTIGTPVATVSYAPIYANGALGSVLTTNPFSSARSQFMLAAYNGYLYGVGGTTNGTAVVSDTNYAKIDTPGIIGSFTADNDSILASPDGVFNGATVIYNGYMYMLGGNNGTSTTNEVRYAQLNADGSTSAWSLTTSFAVARLNPAATAYNGYLYVAGGQATGGATTDCVTNGGSVVYCRDIQKAPINSNGTVGTWVSAGGYFGGVGNPGRDGLGMAAYNGYMYVVGGNYSNNSLVSTEVDTAPINSNGTVGAWTQNATALGATGRSNFQLAQYGRYLYIAGGRLTGSVTSNSIIYTTLSDNGGMSAWGSAGANFTTVRTNNIAAAYNGYLYIAAGDPNTTGNVGKNDIQYAAIDLSSGALSTGWTTLSVTVPTARSWTQGGIYNGYLYIPGGCSNLGVFNNCSTIMHDVQYAPVNNGGGGHTNTFANDGSFTNARSQAAAVAYNGYIYLSGGCTSIAAVTMNGCATSTSDTRYASIAADGTLTWSALASNPTTNRYGHAMAAYNGYLYILGGCSSTGGTNGFCTSVLNDVQRVKLNSNGNITGNSWASAGNNISTARFGLSTTIYNGYIYALGGCSAMASGNCTTFERTVEYAQIDSDGNVGTWATTGGSGFTTGRYQQGAIAFGGNIYVAGGCSAMSSANCTGFQSDVQYAAINTNGTISSTWNTTTSFHTPRYGASLSARNGYLYLSGGCSDNTGGNCTAFQSDVQNAPINSTGTIGNWTGSSNQFTDARYMHTSVISNGYIYVLGGIKTGATQLADSQGAAMLLIPRIGRYSKLVDLSAENGKINNILYNGVLGDSVGNISFKVATTALPTFSSSYAAPDIDLACSSGLGNTKVRYVLVTVLLDDMGGGAGGGTYGETSTANVTDFTVRYNYIRPDPNIRLRLGQTLQQGDLSPFDTCQG
jgi:hypothetical protein